MRVHAVVAPYHTVMRDEMRLVRGHHMSVRVTALLDYEYQGTRALAEVGTQVQ